MTWNSLRSSSFVRPSAGLLHGLLLGLTLYVAVHDPASIYPSAQDTDTSWGSGWLTPILALANVIVWGLTSSAEEKRLGRQALGRLPIVPALAAGSLLIYSLWYAVSVHAPILGWAQVAVACAATLLLSSVLFAAGTDGRGVFVGITAAGIAVCAEGLVHLFSRLEDSRQLIALSGVRYGSGDPFLANRLGNGMLPYPTLLVSLLLVFASISLGLAASAERRWGRLLALAAYLVNVVCIWLTASRGGLVILVLLTFAHIGLIASDTLRGANRPSGLRFMSAGAGCLMALITGFIARLVLTRGSILRADGSLSSRVHMWRICWRVFTQNPLTGGGPGAFQHAWRVYIQHAPYPEYAVPHSLYFGILCEGGIILMAAVAALFCGIALEVWRIARSNGPVTERRLLLAFALGLLAVLVHDLNENSFQMHAIYLLSCVFAGMVIGIRARYLRYNGVGGAPGE